MNSLADHLQRSPEFYPHTFDPLNDTVWLVRMAEAEYRAASFLDQRALGPDKRGDWVAFEDLREAAAGLPERCDFIFHLGHVGSTLLSRLVGAHPQLFSLREPTPLRVLAQGRAELDAPESVWSEAGFEARLSTFLKLWSRSFAPDQTSVIKATSLGCELAGDVLARPADARAIFMYAPPEIFLASILAGPNSRLDLKSMAASRLKRLHKRLGTTPWRLHALSEGEMIAMSWACEAVALREAAKSREDRVLWVEFDRLLAEPVPGLEAAFAHLGRPVGTEDVQRLTDGPIMRRYSKAPEHAYDAALRRDVLQAGREENPEEIRKGLRWLEQAAEAFPAMADAVGFTTRS